MASITKVETGWRARWREPGGGSRSRTFGRKVDAERWLTEVEHGKLVGAYIDPKAGRATFNDFARVHMDRQPWRPRTRDTAQQSLRHVEATLGPRTLGSIRPGDVQAAIARLNLAPSTAGLVAQHVRAVLRAAMLDGLIARDPSVGLKLPRPERGTIDPLTDEQVARLHEAADGPFRVAIVLGAALGLRQSEASGLTVDRIDFLRRTVRVDRQWTRAGGFGPTKTPGSTRTIPVAPPVLDLLALHLERYGSGEHGALVHHGGQPMGRDVWQWRMSKARRAAGLNGVRYHDLRHHAASKLIASGLSVVAVSRFLGHDNASTTLGVYGHLWGDDNDRIRSAMASAWAPVSPACHETGTL